MIKKISFFFLFLCLFIMFINIGYCEDIRYDSWNIDVTWKNGVPSTINASYTILDSDIGDNNEIDIDLAPVMMFLSSKLPSYNNSVDSKIKLNLTLKNASGKKITFNDYDFKTFSYQDYGQEVSFDIEDMVISGADEDTIAYGNILNLYQTFLNEANNNVSKIEAPKSLVINTLGFDERPLRLGYLTYRTLSPAMEALLGADNLVLTKISNIDNIVKQKITFINVKGKKITLDADSTRTYGQYVKAYYDVKTFDELTDDQALEYFNSSINIKGYDSLTLNGYGNGYKYLKIDNINNKVNDNFKHWGQAIATKYNDEFVFNNFLMLESDPEIQQFSYKYIFNNVIRFTLDNRVNSLDSESLYNSKLSLFNYINKTEFTNKLVQQAFKFGTYLETGDSINIPNIEVSYISMNCFNKNNMFDFGLTLNYKVLDEYKRDVVLTQYGIDNTTLLPDMIYKLQRKTEDNNWNDMIEYNHLKTDDKGIIKIESLDIGEYQLIAKIAPSGYELPETITFEIEESEDVTPLFINNYTNIDFINKNENAINIYSKKDILDNKIKYILIVVISLGAIILSFLSVKKVLNNQ